MGRSLESLVFQDLCGGDVCLLENRAPVFVEVDSFAAQAPDIVDLLKRLTWVRAKRFKGIVSEMQDEALAGFYVVSDNDFCFACTLFHAAFLFQLELNLSDDGTGLFLTFYAVPCHQVEDTFQ